MNTVNKRRNLTKELQDQESIDRYLHPQKRTRRSMLKRLIKPLLKDRRIVIGNLLYTISAGLLPLLSALIISYLVQILEKLLQQEVADIRQSKPLLIAIVLYSLVFFLLSLLNTQIRNRLKASYMHIRLNYTLEATGRLTDMELGLAENAKFQYSLGNFFSPVQSSDKGIEGIFNQLTELSGEMLAMLLLSVLLFQIQPLMILLVIFAFLLMMIANHIYTNFHSKLIPAFQKLDKKGQNIENITQNFQYGKDVRVFKMRKALENLRENLFIKRAALQKKLRCKKRLTSLLGSLSLCLPEVGIVFVLGNHYLLQNLPLKDLIMLLSILALYITQINQIAGTFSFIYQELVDLEYYYDFLDADFAIQGGTALPENFSAPFDIEFKDVYFRYPGSEQWVLEGLNLYIPMGKSLALVGVNGAGKTTLTNLLTGLYQPDQGTIKIAGINITNLSQEALNQLIAIVLQDYSPLAISVKENVAASSSMIEEQKVEDVLRQVDLFPKINSFEKGINSMMLRVIEDDGLVLSGGENQKLSIARALYKRNSQILILDEPTSALDALAEQKIYQEFESLMAGRTSIFISHRLASTRFCDQIALLDHGKITQIGTHEELIQQDGLYKYMYETQASYYREGKSDG